MGNLAARLTTVGSLMGRPEQMDEFAAEYERLLQELQAALRTMRELAIAQVGFLQGEAGKQGRMN